MAIKTETISIQGPQGAFDGYLAIPEGGPAPGVIVIQEIFGVNAHIRDVTERMARAGYTALAPDLFWQVQPGFTSGYGPEEIKTARGLMPGVDLDRAVADVGAAMAALTARPESRGDKAGVVGFCWGGLATYLTACRLDPACAAPFYGGRIADFLGEAGKITCPTMFHFGEQDASIPMDQVAQIQATVAGKPGMDVFVYEGAQHGFHCDMRPSYDEPSAKVAWQRTLAFLAKHMA